MDGDGCRQRTSSVLEMSDENKIVLHYQVGVEHHVSSWRNVHPARTEAELRERASHGEYVPDIIVGDLVRWAVPAGRGKKNFGIPMVVEIDNVGFPDYEENFDNLLQYEDMALVLDKRFLMSHRFYTPELHVKVLTNHGIGWVPARFVTRVNKR